MLGISSGVFLIMHQHNTGIQAAKDGKPFEIKKLPSALVAGGFFTFTLGIALDISASSHLKKIKHPRQP